LLMHSRLSTRNSFQRPSLTFSNIRRPGTKVTAVPPMQGI
jgi:hypothetical protein